MVVDPLCVSYGPRGLAPDNQQLAQLLRSQHPGLSKQQQRWMALLLARLPADREGAAVEATQQQLQQALALLHGDELGGGSSTADAQRGTEPSAAAAPGSGGDELPPQQQQQHGQQLPGLDAQAAAALVSSFAYSERYEDLAVCKLKDHEPESFAGIWPAFALMNHSCVPPAPPAAPAPHPTPHPPPPTPPLRRDRTALHHDCCCGWQMRPALLSP
jgi:hypothetical protein